MLGKKKWGWSVSMGSLCIVEPLPQPSPDTQIQFNAPPGVYFMSAVTKSGSIATKVLLE